MSPARGAKPYLSTAEWSCLLSDIDAEAARHSKRHGPTFAADALERAAVYNGRAPFEELRNEALKEVRASYRRWRRRGGERGKEVSLEVLDDVNGELEEK